MDKEQTQPEDINKSIDALIDSIFTEPVEKAGENFEVAPAAKTTADAALASVPKGQDDAGRGAGRPKQISDVPQNDQDGARAKEYDGAIADKKTEEENEEAKKQSRSVDQTTSAGRLGEGPKMKDPRLSKMFSDEELAEFEEFKKSKANQIEKSKQDEIKKAEDLKKAELEKLVKAQVEAALEPVKKENDDLKKSLSESQALIKAMASQPQRAKSVTGIDAIEKSQDKVAKESNEFSKAEKLDAAEALFKAKKLPMDAVIELENTGTVYRRDWQELIETELQKQN